MAGVTQKVSAWDKHRWDHPLHHLNSSWLFNMVGTLGNMSLDVETWRRTILALRDAVERESEEDQSIWTDMAYTFYERCPFVPSFPYCMALQPEIFGDNEGNTIPEVRRLNVHRSVFEQAPYPRLLPVANVIASHGPWEFEEPWTDQPYRLCQYVDIAPQSLNTTLIVSNPESVLAPLNSKFDFTDLFFVFRINTNREHNMERFRDHLEQFCNDNRAEVTQYYDLPVFVDRWMDCVAHIVRTEAPAPATRTSLTRRRIVTTF